MSCYWHYWCDRKVQLHGISHTFLYCYGYTSVYFSVVSGDFRDCVQDAGGGEWRQELLLSGQLHRLITGHWRCVVIMTAQQPPPSPPPHTHKHTHTPPPPSKPESDLRFTIACCFVWQECCYEWNWRAQKKKKKAVKLRPQQRNGVTQGPP